MKRLALTVDKVEQHRYDERVFQAQLRQVVEHSYDGIRVSNSQQSNLFDVSSFGIEGQTYEEKRVGFIKVPKGTTKEQVEAKLKDMPSACLYKVLGLTPILNDEQEAVATAGLRGKALENFLSENNIEGDSWTRECRQVFLNKISEAQTVRYGENNAEGKPADEPVLYNGQVQYRVIYFWHEERDDVDYRPSQAVKESLILTENVTSDVEVEA